MNKASKYLKSFLKNLADKSNHKCSRCPYLFDYIIDVIVHICLSVNSICIHTSINIVLQEKVLEGHQVFLLEGDDHLVAQPEGHQLKQRKD